MNRSSFLKTALVIASAPAILLQSFTKKKTPIQIGFGPLSWSKFMQMMSDVDDNHPGFIFNGTAILNYGISKIYLKGVHKPIFIKKSVFNDAWLEFPLVIGSLVVSSSDTVFSNCSIASHEMTEMNWSGNNSTKFISCKMAIDNKQLYPEVWGNDENGIIRQNDDYGRKNMH